MAIRKTGSRKIVVDGETYLWRIRQRPTYDQALDEAFWQREKSRLDFGVAIQRFEESGSTLVARIRRPRPDNWLGQKTSPVLPSEIACVIRQAIKAGWQPQQEDKQFQLDVEVNDSVTEEIAK